MEIRTQRAMEGGGQETAAVAAVEGQQRLEKQKQVKPEGSKHLDPDKLWIRGSPGSPELR